MKGCCDSGLEPPFRIELDLEEHGGGMRGTCVDAVLLGLGTLQECRKPAPSMGDDRRAGLQWLSLHGAGPQKTVAFPGNLDHTAHAPQAGSGVFHTDPRVGLD